MPETQRSPGRSISASKVVTKNKFIEQLQPIKCSICLDGYNSDHVPVELPCGHIFGGHCIVEQTEIRMPNNNRCPLCRHELFEQEDFSSFDDTFYGSDEALIEFDDYDDFTDEDERELEEGQRRQMLVAPLSAQLARRTQLTSSAPLGRVTNASRRERNIRHQEFREHASRRRDMSRTFAPKLPGRTRTYNQIEASDAETDADWSASEYEPEDDTDPIDERDEKRAYRLLPGEYDTTLPTQPSASS